VPEGLFGQLIDFVLKIAVMFAERCFLLAAVLQCYGEKNCISATLEGPK